MTGTSEPAKRLDGMGAIGKAFKFVFGNLGHLFATSTLTLFVVALFQIAYTWVTIDGLVEVQTQALISTEETDVDELLSSFRETFFSSSATYMMTASFVISLVFGGMFAIRWHRSALFGSDADNTGFGLEFSASLWRYVLYVMAISIITTFVILVPISLALVLAASLGEIGILVGFVAIVATLIAGLYILSRLYLVLPAAALSIPGFGLAEAWQHTKGHGWGILGSLIVLILSVIVVLVLCSIPLALLGDIFIGAWVPPMTDNLDQLMVWQNDVVMPRIWWDTLSSLPLYPVITGIVTSFYSYIYLQIGKPPAWVEEQGEA